MCAPRRSRADLPAGVGCLAPASSAAANCILNLALFSTVAPNLVTRSRSSAATVVSPEHSRSWRRVVSRRNCQSVEEKCSVWALLRHRSHHSRVRSGHWYSTNSSSSCSRKSDSSGGSTCSKRRRGCGADSESRRARRLGTFGAGPRPAIGHLPELRDGVVGRSGGCLVRFCKVFQGAAYEGLGRFIRCWCICTAGDSSSCLDVCFLGVSTSAVLIRLSYAFGGNSGFWCIFIFGPPWGRVGRVWNWEDYMFSWKKVCVGIGCWHSGLVGVQV